MKTFLCVAVSAALLGSSVTTLAATKREPVGVLGGALAGAVAAGPVGALVGGLAGARYITQSDRLAERTEDLADVMSEFDAAQRQLDSTLDELELAENRLLERSRALSAQDQRIEQLVEDQMLLSALQLRVRFATNDATITEDDHETLAILARYLARHPEIRVRLDGHADARGSEAHNDKLSIERSRAVAAALSSRDVVDQQIDIRGFGEREAAADEKDPDLLAAERRVEVQLVQPDETTERVSNTLK